MTDDIKDLRASQRFLVTEPLAGSFGSASIAVLDISEHGVQVEHAQPVRIGTRARLWFKRGDIAVNIQGRVTWSHLSKTPNEKGKLLYRSGIQLDNTGPEYVTALQGLVDKGVIRRDDESLEKKRKRLLDRETDRTTKPVVKIIRPEIDVSPDQVLLIQHARERLKSNPAEKIKWSNRAKFAVAETGSLLASDSIRDREDVLAVWEYLDRTIDLATIVKVFQHS
jgi:hypothetical protein